MNTVLAKIWVKFKLYVEIIIVKTFEIPSLLLLRVENVCPPSFQLQKYPSIVLSIKLNQK